MGFGNKARSTMIALAAVAATAGLLYLGNGLSPRWPLMWLAPLPVLVFALRRPAWQTGVVAWSAWMAGGLNLWGYLHSLGALPAVLFIDFGTAAAVFAAAVLLMRALARRRALWSAWIALPAVWVAFEFARNLWLSPHGSAMCIAYSQLNFLPFLQLASLAGPWGMGFVLMLFPTGLALAIHQWTSGRKEAARMLCATIGIVAVVLIFGAVRLVIPQPGPKVRAGLIVSDADGGASVDNPEAATHRLFENYAEHAAQLIVQGARVVVMPEKVGVALDADASQTDTIFQPIADRTGAVLVVGMARIGAAGRHNQARVYTPDAPVRSYNKEHLFPPFETRHFSPGKSRTVIAGNAGGQTWASLSAKTWISPTQHGLMDEQAWA